MRIRRNIKFHLNFFLNGGGPKMSKFIPNLIPLDLHTNKNIP